MLQIYPNDGFQDLVGLCTPDRFADLTGLPVGVVRSQIEHGHWPVIKVGKRLLVNLIAVRQLATNAAEGSAK